MEDDIANPGNDLNDGVNNQQADAEACRLSCRSISGANYFDWTSPKFDNSYYHGGCWCKDSDAGRKDSVGVVSGNVNCVDETVEQGKN